MDRIWILNCAVGELLGFTAAALFNVIHLQLIGEPVGMSEQLMVILLATIGGLAEGSILAVFQWRILREYLPTLELNQWIYYTALVAAFGWFLGMLYPTFFLEPNSTSSEEVVEPSIVVIALLGLGMGMLLGALFGVFQYIPLKKHTDTAKKWIFANSIAWSGAMIVLMIGPSIIPAGASVGSIILVAAISGVVAGVTIGVVTGLFLNALHSGMTE